MPKYRVVASGDVVERDDIPESLIPLLYVPLEEDPEKADERTKVHKSRR